MVKFKAKIRNGGNSYIITIPRSYIDNNLLEPEKIYIFEAKKEGKHE